MNRNTDYINYRLTRAFETFDEALILAENKKWNATINRLYYASFYAVSALLLKSGLDSSSHDGVRTQFGLHFVKTGLIDKEKGRLFTKLFDFRQKGDNGDMFDFDEEIVQPLINQTKNFIDDIVSLANSN